MSLAAKKSEYLFKTVVALRALMTRGRCMGRRIQIHRTSWVSVRSTLRLNCGGSISIGKQCEIHPYALLLTYGGDIKIGDHCSVNPFSIIYGCGGATIGNGVRIAAQVVIIPESHNPGTDELPLHRSGTTRKGICIEDNVWIGAGAKILDGVTIGRNCIIGAGAVVNRSLPPNATAVGVPARIIRIAGSAVSCGEQP
jgi:acetyltransferase-like isoleucine patch superfamily enzyme